MPTSRIQPLRNVVHLLIICLALSSGLVVTTALAQASNGVSEALKPITLQQAEDVNTLSSPQSKTQGQGEHLLEPLLPTEEEWLLEPALPIERQRAKISAKNLSVQLVGVRLITFQLNQKRQSAFKDKRVRLAMANAIDQRAIVQQLFADSAMPAAQLSPPGYLGHNLKLSPRYDLLKAKQWMKEAGYESGFHITLMAPKKIYPKGGEVARLIADMLVQLGLKVDLKIIKDPQRYQKLFKQQAADVMMVGSHSNVKEQNDFYWELSACPNAKTLTGRRNSSGACHHSSELLMHDADKEQNVKKRGELFQQVELILHQEAMLLPLYWHDLCFGGRSRCRY